MAAPGETPDAQFQRGDELAYGQAHAANALMGMVPTQDVPDYQPKGDAENFIYNDTARPHEPVTHGAPFGDGANGVRLPLENDNTFMRRVTDQAAADPNAPATLKEFARRVAEGQ